jgi:hypothetical protein
VLGGKQRKRDVKRYQCWIHLIQAASLSLDSSKQKKKTFNEDPFEFEEKKRKEELVTKPSARLNPVRFWLLAPFLSSFVSHLVSSLLFLRFFRSVTCLLSVKPRNRRLALGAK